MSEAPLGCLYPTLRGLTATELPDIPVGGKRVQNYLPTLKCQASLSSLMLVGPACVLAAATASVQGHLSHGKMAVERQWLVEASEWGSLDLKLGSEQRFDQVHLPY